MPAISPDGTKVATLADASTIYVYDLSTKKVRELPNNSSGSIVAGWTADSRSVYVSDSGHVPATVSVVDVATGQRKPWKTLSPRILQAWTSSTQLWSHQTVKPMLMA